MTLDDRGPKFNVDSGAMSLSSAASAAALMDDDGRAMRKGTMWTAAAHIITGVIGSGVLSLAWCIAKLGWLAGPVALLAFGAITYFTSLLLADCYRQQTHDLSTTSPGKRNYTYMEAVRADLGEFQTKICAIVQYANLLGVSVGYTIAASISLAAIIRSNCFHTHGHDAPCEASSTRYILIFGGLQLVLSQIPSFSKLWWLSILAAVMSFSYSTIGTGLGIAHVVSNGGRLRGTVSGSFASVATSGPGLQNVWSICQALGDIAFAYAYSLILLEIQDTLKSSETWSESKTMKKANLIGVSTTTVFYMLCGCAGYAAFGASAPGNLLTGFGFYEPFWLVDIANVCVVVHLIGAYQVFIQPFFAFVENSATALYPDSKFLHREYHPIQLRIPFARSALPLFSVNLFRLLWRSTLVVIVTLTAMLIPFFNDILGVLGAITFWPLTVYFPIAMHLKQTGTRRWSAKWCALQILSLFCLCVSVVALVGSVQGVVANLHTYNFKF